MSKEDLENKELVEFKADGEDSSVMDPTNVSAKKRKADVFQSENPTADSVKDLLGINRGEKLIGSQKAMAQAAARKADNRSMKESVDALFEGSELSEEFKTKATTMFEAAVIERVSEIEDLMNEEFEAKLEEVAEALANKMDSYLNYVAEQWLEENQVALVSEQKVARADAFMEALSDLFAEHSIKISDEEIDVVETLENEIVELKNKLNVIESEKIELANKIQESKIENVIDEISEGLTETQKDKLLTLAENIEFDSVDEFKSKIEIIKESFIGTKTSDAEEVLNEEYTGEDSVITPVLDPAMQSYLAAVSRTFRK
jgi:hypothetical protein